MTAEAAGPFMGMPDPIGRRLADHTELVAGAEPELVLTAPFGIEPALRDIAP